MAKSIQKSPRKALRSSKGITKSPNKVLTVCLDRFPICKSPLKGRSLKKGHALSDNVEKSLDDNDNISKQVVLTRRGRPRRNTDEHVKVSNKIFNGEPLTKHKRKMKSKAITNGVKNIKSIRNNNNDTAVSDQNIDIDNHNSILTDKKLNGNAYNSIENNVQKKVKRTKKKDSFKPKNPQTISKELRNGVLSKMRNVLNSDDLPLAKSKEKSKKKSAPTFMEEDCDSDNDPLYVPEKKKPKGRQVTLSNGVVLTLSLLNCEHCERTFTTKSSLNRHVLSHEDSRVHSCGQCDKKFKYKSTLQKHVSAHHPELKQKKESHFCGICDKTFSMKENLELHLTTHMKKEKHACADCGKTFSYQLLLAQHEKTQHTKDNNVYTCFLCHTTFESRFRLQDHMKIHTKTKEYICHQCGKGFLRVNSIKRHVLVCHDGQRIQCPICFKELKGHLSEHMRVHEDSRPHKCPECGVCFKQSTQLTVHRRIHLGVRPYVCRICDRPFTHSNALLQHIRKHTRERPFTCAKCPLTFTQLPHMKTHMSKIHGIDCIYKCKKCNEFFRLRAQLDSHVKGCTVGDKVLSFEEKIQASVQYEEIEVESVMTISRMRYLLALLFTMITSKGRLKVLGFNKRPIDDLLNESLEAMDFKPCNDVTLTPIQRLRSNIEMLLDGTIPKEQMSKFRGENKTTEDVLLLLTDEKKEKM